MVCYLAFAKDRCVGQTVVVENWNSRAVLWEISVDIQSRRKGIGRELLLSCEEWAKRKKLFGLMVEVPDSNPIGCQFFESCGFKLGGVDQKLYHSLPSQQHVGKNFKDTALFLYKDF